MDNGDREEEEEEYEENQDEFDFDDFSESDGECSNKYHLEAHKRLRRSRSEHIILACYLSKSVNELIILLSGIVDRSL